MRKSLLLGAVLAAALPAAASQAAVTVDAEESTNPYSGPTPPTYDFTVEGSAPITGGDYRTGSDAIASQPFGGDANYYAIGPGAGTPAFLDLSSFAAIGQLTFTWGSVDIGNTLTVLDRADNILATITGTQIQGLARPGTAGQHLARGALVTLKFSGGDEFNIGGLGFASRINSFEIDNVTVGAVPEPGVWALMLLGFAGVGFSMRRRKSKDVRVRYAF